MSKASKQQKTPSRPRSECACFIESVLPELGDLYHVAETSLHEIPAHTLISLRSCCMLFAQEYLRRHNHSVDYSGNLNDILESYEFIESSSEDLRKKLHELRQIANRAAHPEQHNAPTADELARHATRWLKVFYQIVIKCLADNTKGIPEFKLPDADSSNRLCGDAVLRDDAEAQYRLGLRAKMSAVARIKKRKDEAGEGAMTEVPETSGEYEEAYFWFQKAARDGRSPAALYQMALLNIDGIIEGGSPEQGIDFMYEAARLGDAASSARLGLFALNELIFDSQGTRVGDFEDRERMIDWLEYAASDGNPEALNGLVAIYQSGRLAPKNLKRALTYARSAADAGFPLAKFNLVLLYQSGIGEERSPGEVVSLLKDAAEGGVLRAYAHLCHVYRNGDGAEVDFEVAKSYLEKGCQHGDPHAMVIAVNDSIHRPADEREACSELMGLLQAIDHLGNSPDIREFALTLLPHSVGHAQRRVANLLDEMVSQQPLSGAVDENEFQVLIWLLASAAAEPRQGDELDTQGMAVSRSTDIRPVIDASRDIFHTDVSPYEFRQACKALKPLVPQFSKWEALERKKEAQRTAGKMQAKFTRRLRRTSVKVGRNDSCPCASGRKYKRCCGVPS